MLKSFIWSGSRARLPVHALLNEVSGGGEVFFGVNSFLEEGPRRLEHIDNIDFLVLIDVDDSVEELIHLGVDQVLSIELHLFFRWRS